MVGFGSADRNFQSESHTFSSANCFPSGEQLQPTFLDLELEFKSPFEVYRRLYPHFDNSFILESPAGPEEMASYTFMGFDPQTTIAFRDGLLYKENELISSSLSPLNQLEGIVDRLQLPSSANGVHQHKYVGGLVGYIGYDFVRYLHKLPPADEGSAFPDLQMGLYLDGIVHHEKTGRLQYFYTDRDRSGLIKDILQGGEEAPYSPLQVGKLESDTSREEFVSMVRRAKEYIRSGDIYQTVLSRKLVTEFEGDPLNSYIALREINPSPYMYHLKFGNKRVIGSSPEMLASVEGDTVTTYPIAGTRPLGETEREKQLLRTELLEDEKELAEHNMLVDLARNDVGRISKYGSVTVPIYQEVKEFSHVQHIVSKVQGTLGSKVSSVDAFGSIFPAGTVSGAPQLRAMEIIDELEKSPRGPYAGAVGYFSLNGNLDSCITIRSLFSEGSQLSLQAGAGIVADSVGEKEWEETGHKLDGVRQALRYGGDL